MDGVGKVMEYLDAGNYRYYPEVKSDDDETKPYFIVRLIRENVPANETLMPSGVSVDRVQVDTYADTPRDVSSTAREIRTLLESKGDIWFNTGANLPEQDSNGVIIYRRVQEYTVRY